MASDLERGLRLERLAASLDGALRAVHDDVELLRRVAEHLFRHRSAYGALLPSRTYERHRDGYLWSPRDEGGSALVVSSRTEVTGEIGAMIRLGEHLDPVLFEILRRNPSVAQAYFNTEETVCRIAPWFDVEKAAELKLLPTDFDIRDPAWPFYHVAARERNPGRSVAWTGLYLDPVGRGWMVSCCAPAYLDDGSLRGVAGLDVTVAQLGAPLGAGSEADPLMLLSRDGVVLHHSPGVPELLGLPAGAPGDMRLDRTESALAREILAIGEAAGEKGVGERQLAWRTIPETGWRLVTVHPKRESYGELERRSRGLDLAQQLMARTDAADVAASVVLATREALGAGTAALWWLEGGVCRRVAVDGPDGDRLGPASFSAPSGVMAEAAADPGRAVGTGTGRLSLAMGSPSAGFLAAERSAPFSEEDARLFALIGHTAALALENVAQFRRLAQAQKMEGLGAIATAVAHDFNNLLGSILGNASLLRMSIPQVDEHTRRLIELIETSAQRGASLTRQLLLFTRGGAPQRSPVAVGALFSDLLLFLRQSLPKSVVVETSVAPGLAAIEVDATQIQQVLVNLCLNARDAMPAGGTIRLSATAEGPVASRGAAGQWVRIEVADTGTGMSPEVLERVFDPFFTTKPPGQGTGLGLPIAQRIVRDHHGLIEVKSQPSQGATVRVYLPASAREPQAAPGARPEMLRTGHGEAILVVDDEPAVLAVMSDSLHQAGYAPVAASSGPEALRLLAARREELRLLVMDLVMPEMSGVELLHRVRAAAPELRVLVTSGYVQSSMEPALRELGVTTLLEKPFTSAELLDRVRQVLAAGERRSPTPRPRMSPKRGPDPKSPRA